MKIEVFIWILLGVLSFALWAVTYKTNALWFSILKGFVSGAWLGWTAYRLFQ